MSYWQALNIFISRRDVDAWTRIEANLTIAVGNLIAVLMMMVIGIALKLWLRLHQ